MLWKKVCLLVVSVGLVMLKIVGVMCGRVVGMCCFGKFWCGEECG